MTLAADAGLRRSMPLSPRLRAAARARTTPIAWAAMGFILGAVFWHLVGFWDFVSGIVFNGRSDAEAVTIVSRHESPAIRWSQQVAAGSVTRGCIALALDRSRGAIETQPCTSQARHLRDAGLGTREDSAAIGVAPGWRATASTGLNPTHR